MPTYLEFTAAHRYAGSTGIDVPVTLRAGGQSVEFISGRLLHFRTVTGSFAAYEHELIIQTLGIEFPSTAYFAQSIEFNRNVLGRAG